MRVTNELPIEAVRITWIKVELWAQDLVQKGILITCGSRRKWLQVILGMYVIQVVRAEMLEGVPCPLGST